MGAPQVIWVAAAALWVGIAVARHGQDRGQFNGWHEMVNATVAAVLLWWGGFFG